MTDSGFAGRLRADERNDHAARLQHQVPATPEPLNKQREHPPEPGNRSEHRAQPPQSPQPPGDAPAKHDASGHGALGLDGIQQLPKQRWVDTREPSHAKRFSALRICCLAEPAQLPRDVR